MIFGYFTLFVALTISVVAEFYSIVGLTAIFAAAFWPVVIMGAALGVGKVTAAVWLKLNWERAKWTYKVYLVPAVVFLMFLTSMGIFGFLSKAHSDQSLVSGDVQSKIAIYDEKIKTAKENIEAIRRQLKQMDEAVDQVMARSTTEEGATKANNIRRSQLRDRTALARDIEANQKLIANLNEESAPIRAEVRKVEAEVGPIKYIAAMIYGDNPDANLLESAVRWVIILIVAVFDPLALMLILAAQQSLRWAREDREQETYKPDVWVSEVGEKPKAEELAEIESSGDETAIESELGTQQEPEVGEDPHPPGWMFDKKEGDTPDEVTKDTETRVEHNPVGELSLLDSHPYLNKPFVHFQNLKPMVAQIDDYQKIEPVSETEPAVSVNNKFPKVPETAERTKTPAPAVPETMHITKLRPDNVDIVAPKSDFGTAFPDTADKGDMFLRVDQLPNKLFKYNGAKWIEVDKSNTDSYAYDEQYILFLIEKLQSGEYDLDQLSTSEQELVAEKLKKITNDNT